MHELLQGNVEMEQTRERTGKYIGRLSDLGLGNPDGIPSKLASADNDVLQEIAEQDAHDLVMPTDLACTACIDGRHILCNADGSTAEIRLRRVGGSASNFGVALNAEASVVDTLDLTSPLGEQIATVDDFVGERSAHLGGCGGANGEIEDNELISTDLSILKATKTLMEIPEVRNYLGVDYDESLGERVRANAGKTAEFLRTNGWDGQRYVDGVKAENPRGVEDLEVDEDDHKFHGHKENKVVIIIGDLTSNKDDEFVWNLKASKEVAKLLSGQRGKEGYQQAIIAEIAKHMAVCKRLPSQATPVVLLSDEHAAGI